MINKVVFFMIGMSSHEDRRVKEFVSNGFDVEVYGGGALSGVSCDSLGYKYNVIYELNGIATYSERVRHLPLFWNVIQKYDKNNTLFYFCSLNVAVLALLIPNLNYVYEECDMLFDRFRNPLLQKILIKINKHIIKNSFLTIFTSEGFVDFYYGCTPPKNVVVIPNRVGPEIKNVKIKEKDKIDFGKLRLGFVGYARYKSIVNVSDTVEERIPGGVFHYFGDLIGLDDNVVSHLKSQGRVILHGAFKYPEGLVDAYSTIDFSICTYDISGVNTRYAEPNKIYEAIFFETPIIVTSNTFLAKKVEKLGIGFSVDSDNKEDIYNKIMSITPLQYESYLNALRKIPKERVINVNDNFFKILKENLSCGVRKMSLPNVVLD